MAKKKQSKTQSQSTSADPVEAYALAVTSGREVAGPLVRAACARHLKDLERPDLYWDLPAAQRVFGFFEECLHLAGGEFEAQPFKLALVQKFILGSLFGWKLERDHSRRRFREAYIEMGKGQGKSPLGGGLGNYMMCADGEWRAECYAAAADKEQAKTPFKAAVAQIDLNPDLADRIEKSPRNNPDVTKVWNLAHLDSGSFFRPIASESMGRGKSGFFPYFVLLDEVHEHPTNAMVEFMRKNAAKRRNSLVFMITNSGVVDKESVCWHYHQYAEKVVTGVHLDDTFFGFVCGLDKGDDWKNPEVWKKACPMLDITVPRDMLATEVQKAEGMPSLQSLTRRLNFCEWVQSADPWVAVEVWLRNSRKVDLEALRGRKCWGGLDLSRRDDFTALVLVFDEDEDGIKAVVPFFWKPEDTLQQHADRDGVDYVRWKEDGLLLTCPGASINYEFIAAELDKIAARYELDYVAFDPAKIDELVPYLNDIGASITMKPHRQGYAEMDPAIQSAEDDLLNGRFAHGDHEVLTSQVNNVKVVKNPANQRMFSKRDATGRIDGAVAFVLAAHASSATTLQSSYASTVI